MHQREGQSDCVENWHYYRTPFPVLLGNTLIDAILTAVSLLTLRGKLTENGAKMVNDAEEYLASNADNFVPVLRSKHHVDAEAWNPPAIFDHLLSLLHQLTS